MPVPIDAGSLRGRKALVIRYGAYGDCVILTPVLRFLKQHGATVIFHGSERAQEVLKHSRHIDEWIPYTTKQIPNDELEAFWKKVAQDCGADFTLNLTGAIEDSLSPHPSDPHYNYPKWERHALCNRNFYEHQFEWVGLPVPTSSDALRPSMDYTEQERSGMDGWMRENVRYGERLMVVCWSGSGRNKQYPYMENVVGEMLMRHPDLTCVVVGDAAVHGVNELAKQHGGRICSRAGHWSFREAALATEYADVVLSPDTGILHVAGCTDVPKVGIIGHNTIENITKHFLNDFSLEADRKNVECAPCHKLIYSGYIQCPVDPVSTAVWCQAFGFDPKVVCDRLEAALNAKRSNRRGDGRREEAVALQQA